jgi:hypothetical protein
LPRRCNHCGEHLTGQGSNNAKLCPDCWTLLLHRVMDLGDKQNVVAREFGVCHQAVSQKLAALALEGA